MRKQLLYMVLAFSSLSTSCFRDSASTPTPGAETRTEQEVTFALQMPAAYTTSVASVDENHVQTAYILAFRSEDGMQPGQEVYEYSSLAYSITDGSQSRYKTLGVTLLIKDYNQKFVIVTNAKPAVEALGLQSGAHTKAEVLAMLEFGNSTPWHSAMDAFTPIPMWGEADPTQITDNTSRIGTVTLTRMVSKIEVVKDDAIGDEKFTVTSLHLYNHLKNGRVAPNTASTHWDPSEGRALLPTMPTVDSHKIKGPHPVSCVAAGDGSMIVPSVYAFESQAPALGAASDATCLVIGGKYDGSARESFYRVDFVDRDTGGQVTGYKHLLRNHMYLVNINDVLGSGHETPDEAFDSRAVNMNVDIKEWDEGDIAGVVFDKDYYLGVSQLEYNVGRQYSKDNILIVTTDHPDGWTISVDADWLDAHGAPTVPEAKDNVILEIKENNTDDPRTAIITVSAGRMSIKVKVIQGIGTSCTLELLDSGGDPLESMLFTAYGSELGSDARSFRAEWTPDYQPCMISYYVTGVNGVTFNHRPNPFSEVVIYTGSKDYSVQPDDFTAAQLVDDPFMEKSSRANFVVGEGEQAVVRTLKLRQVHYDLFATPADTYPVDGSIQQFTLETNGSWEVEMTGGNRQFITPERTSGQACPAGEPFKFTMADDPDGNISERTVTLRFKYTGEDGRFAYKTVVINGEPARGLKTAGDANSYILEPDGEGVEIPLSWANSDGKTRIGANETVEIKLIWVDRNPTVSKVVDSYKLTGTGADRKIEVYPGPAEGNALIGAYVGGQVRWSWHIWVTDYDIDGTRFTASSVTWMNVNLGAITDAPGNADSFGMFYQWGRKDPFPPNRAVNTAGQKALWTESGADFYVSVADVTATDNVEYAITVPTTVFTGTGKTGDGEWLSPGNTGSASILWNSSSNQKTIFDPCPAGWRVPSGTGPFTTLGYNGSWASSTYGRNFSLGGGNRYFQAAGIIDENATYRIGLNNASIMSGSYWSATVSGLGGMSLLISNNSTNLTQYGKRSNAMSVRCVRE